MAKPLSANVLLRRPALTGSVVGFALAVGISIFIPAADLQPGDSRVLIGMVGIMFLVPGSIATVYATRLALNNVRALPRLQLVWIFAGLFFTVAAAISAHSEWNAARQYAREGQNTTGTVIETHPEDHDTLRVAYSVAGTDYRRRTTGARVARSYKPGDSIQVFYYISAPGEGFCVEPRWRPDMVLLSWVVAAGIMPLFLIGFGGAFVLRRQRALYKREDKI